MKRRVVFKPQALEHLRWLPVRQQRLITDGIRRPLVENDPRIESRNKFRLRRGSVAADYELRLPEGLRVSYRIEGPLVFITVVARKLGHVLTVKGEELAL